MNKKHPNYIPLGGTYGRSWKIENMQRNYIKEACKDFAAKDIIIISDLDEIPSKEKIKFIKSCDFQFISPVAFEHFLFHLDCNHLNLEKWIGSIAVTKEIFDKSKPQELRNNRYKISCVNKIIKTDLVFFF